MLNITTVQFKYNCDDNIPKFYKLLCLSYSDVYETQSSFSF